MLHRINKKSSNRQNKSKGPTLSLHFKELDEIDSVEEPNETEIVHKEKEFNSLIPEFSSDIRLGGIDMNSNDVQEESDSSKGTDPLLQLPVNFPVSNRNISHRQQQNRKPLLEHQVKLPSVSTGEDLFVFKSNKLIDEKSENDPQIHVNQSPKLQIHQKSHSVETVENHPLALSSEQSSEEEDYTVQDAPKTANVKMNQEIHGQTPVKTSVSDSGISTPNETSTKAMISSALFNSKARTKLFSTIKKNIQHYTTSTKDVAEPKTFQYTRFKGSDFDVIPDEEMVPQDKTESQSSDMFNSENSLMKGIKGKVVEPLQAMKRTWAENHKENQLSNESFLRKRSSSENDFNLGTSSKSSLEFDLDKESLKNKNVTEKPPWSGTMAMSFSTLLAERRNNQEDRVSLSSDEISGKKSENEESSIKQEKMYQDEISIQYSSTVKEFPEADEADGLALSSSSIYIFFLLVYFYIILPIPVSVHISVFCFLSGFTCATLLLCLFTSSKRNNLTIKPPYINLAIPHYVPSSVYNPNQPHKGWMNEINHYDVDTYHISVTQSVFVTLEGSTLRLQTPRRNIARRATFGESNIPVSNVIHQRIYNMANSKVYLLPEGLVKKRVWSKKYPICIEFTPNKAVPNSLSENSFKEKKEHTETEHNDSYEVIGTDDLIEKIYLFGRTERQKEEWFYRFQRAIALIRALDKKKCEIHKSPSTEKDNASNTECENESFSSEGKEKKVKLEYENKNKNDFDPLATYQDYYTSMCRLLPDPAVYTAVNSGSGTQMNGESTNTDKAQASHFPSKSGSAEFQVISSQPRTLRNPLSKEPGLEVAWFNVVVGRIMFDFLRRPKWENWLSSKIQKKLEKIRLPYFMEGLKLTGMDLGTAVPLVHKISLPRLDAQGIWLDMEVTYVGNVRMTLETKMVLTKLGKQHPVLSMNKKKMDSNSAITNSDEEDSAESSDDDESAVAKLVSHVQSAVPSESALSSPLQYLSSGNDNLHPGKQRDRSHSSASTGNTQQTSTSAASTPQQEKRWVRIVDSITKSKYFQRATENNYIRKKLETVSNTPLVLTAELHQCQGTMCLNIPPPPTDRVWYGFKDHPHMVLRAHPKFGEREVSGTSITDWIEKKLLQEFNKFLLMPNMDDIPVPVMFNNLPTPE